MKNLYFLLVIIVFSINLNGQSFDIKGQIFDSEDNALIGATVVVLTQTDSTMLAFGLTNDDGKFEIYDVETGEHLLQVTYTGYKDNMTLISIGGKSKMVDLGLTVLEESSEILDVVSIKAEHIPMGILGDTINYNAAAFHTKPGESVEDLLKKLPGIEVGRDGQIKAQGEDVNNVLVDGKEFFNGDPTIATKNLEAEAVDKVQVFDKKSEEAEFTGVDDGEEEKTINLKLKDGYKNGGFGKISADVGTEDTRHLKMNYNAFSPKLQASIIGNHNTINEQAFSFNDYISFMGGIQNALSSGGGYMMRNNQAPQGINNQNAIGTNLNIDFTNKLEMNTNYLYADSDIDLNSSNTSETFLNNSSFETTDESSSVQKTFNHRFRNKIKYKINPRNVFSLETKLFSIKDDNIQDATTTYLIDGNPQNITTTDIQNIVETFNIDTKLNFRKKYGKKGRSWISNMSFKRTSQNETADLNNKYEYLGIDEIVLQQQALDNTNLLLNAETKYTEPIGFGLYLTGHYRYSNEQQEPNRNYYDQVSGESTLNEELSGTFSHHWISHRPGISLKRNRKKLKIEGRLSLVNTQLKVVDKSSELNRDTKKTFFIPSLNFDWKLRGSASFDIRYNSRVVAPTLSQLITQTDNQNPNFIVLGNPDLLPEVMHTFRLNYSKFDQFNFSNIFTNLEVAFAQDKIVNTRSYQDNLTTVVRPINTKDYMRALYYLSYSHPIRALKLKYRINTTIQYSNYKTLVNAVDNGISQGNITFDLRFENRKKERFDAAFGIKLNANANKNEQFSNFDNPFFNYSGYTDVHFKITESLHLETKFDYLTYNGGFFAERQVLSIWNMSLSKSFQDDKYSIRISAHDIFNQNKGIARNGGLNSYFDTRFNTLGRYVMLGVSYRLGKKKKDEGIIVG